MKTKKMDYRATMVNLLGTIIVLGLIIFSIIIGGCRKDIDVESPKKDQVPEKKVELNFSIKEGKSTKEKNGLIVSGQTLSGNINYYFNFWLSPASGENIALGIFTITNEGGTKVYETSTPENGIDFKATATGDYTLSATGNYGGENFSFTNITIKVTSGGVDPEDPNPTSPVTLKNLRIVNDNALVDVTISKKEYSEYSNVSWFHVYRINGSGFQGNQAVINETDSIKFTLTFSATNQNYVEFNAGFYNNADPWWFTPNAGQTPSILYAGGANTPFTSSGNYFGFRLVVNGQNAEIRSYSGITILTTSTGSNDPIPGNNGDGPANNYQVRWSGYTHYFKTTDSNPTFRYRIGATGTYTFLPATQVATNTAYYSVEIPSGTTGELRMQFGTGTGANFLQNSTMMSNSMYYETSTQELAKNL